LQKCYCRNIFFCITGGHFCPSHTLLDDHRFDWWRSSILYLSTR